MRGEEIVCEGGAAVLINKRALGFNMECFVLSDNVTRHFSFYSLINTR